MKRGLATMLAYVCLLVIMTGASALAAAKPNILVIWGDDVGYWNVSAYNQGMMGYETPNIDSVAKEGALFTDWYAQQSCTAGRAAFILGQHPFRTGLLTIGMPGSPHSDPTATPAGSSARTTSATRTSTCRRSTVLMNFSATSTTSTPKRSPRATTTRRIPSSVSSSAPAA